MVESGLKAHQNVNPEPEQNQNDAAPQCYEVRTGTGAALFALVEPELHQHV
jgi:hypothetical protein